MLSAVTEEGRLVNLIEHRQSNMYNKLKSHGPFYCPDCHEQVILKQGEYRIPHFAHQKNSFCIATSEPESQIHLQGKKDLYLWLRNQNLEVYLEKYIPDIKQRPDLFVKKNGVRFAIEFQCSAIPARVMESRTKGYASVHIIPIWILGGNFYQKKIKYDRNEFQLTDFQWRFARFNKKNGIYVYSYHPPTQQIQLLSHLTPILPSKVIAQPSSKNLSHYSFPFHFDQSIPKIKIPDEMWFRVKKKWLQQKMMFAKSLRDPLLSSIYYSRLTPLLIPPIIGIPVDFMVLSRSHPLVWQFFIWHDVIRHLNIGQSFPFSTVENKMKRREHMGHIHLRKMPFIDPLFHKQMYYQYLRILVKLDYLKEVRKGYFIMNNSIPIPNNIGDVTELERKIICRLNKN